MACRALTRRVLGCAPRIISVAQNGGVTKNSEVIKASGVVPWRRIHGDVEILVIHRPHYNDWSVPKGKLDDGETDEECAIREMTEETGFTGVLGAPLPTALYEHNGRPKEVSYWLMEIEGGSEKFVPNSEVDTMEWLPIAEARQRLTYELDQALVTEAVLVLRDQGIPVTDTSPQ